MSVLTKNSVKRREILGHNAAWLGQWLGVTFRFGSLVDPQLWKLAVFDTKRHSDGRRTRFHSAADQEMLSMCLEPIM